MTISMLISALSANGNGMAVQALLADVEKSGEKTAKFRRYYEGDQDNKMPPEVRRMMNAKANGSSTEFSGNFCPLVINTEANRIRLTGIDADNDAATEWLADIFKKNQFDKLQSRLHTSALLDGNTCLLVDIVEDEPGNQATRRVHLSHEPFYDGSYGVWPIYKTTASKSPMVVLKIWHETSETIADTVRVNAYYDNRVERFIGREGSSLQRFDGDGQAWLIAWTMDGKPDGEAIGVPFVHFRNRGATHSSYGLSEIEPVISYQDVYNHNFYSSTYTQIVAAFPHRVFIGALFPAAVSPGMVTSFYAKDASGNPILPTEAMQKWLDSIRLEQFDAAAIDGYIAFAQWIEDQIYTVSSTPKKGDAADTSSGESLKQREIELISKVENFQVDNGSTWEDAAVLMHRVQMAFAEKPPAYTSFQAKWKDPQVRNDKELIDTILRLHGGGLIDDQTALEELAPLFDWSEEKIAAMVTANEQRKQEDMRAAVRGLSQAAFGGNKNGKPAPKAIPKAQGARPPTRAAA